MHMHEQSVVRLQLYPIKSLDGISVEEVRFTAEGGLLNDRRYALLDASSSFVNGKSDSSVHLLHALFDEKVESVTFRIRASEEAVTFRLEEERSAINGYLSEYFRKTITLEEDTSGRFLDDPDQSQVTIVSTASLQTIADHFGFSLDECRRRFRTNIELGGVPPFWEERLVLPAKQPVRFRIGEVSFVGVKPCPRCVVPSRHPDNGESDRGFQRELAELRRKTLPEWSPLATYGNYYQLAVSCKTVPLKKGESLSVGDQVQC